MGEGRIVMGLLFFRRGGSAYVVRYLSPALSRAGWSVSLAVGSLGAPGEHTHAPTFECVVVLARRVFGGDHPWWLVMGGVILARWASSSASPRLVRWWAASATSTSGDEARRSGLLVSVP